MVGNEVALSEPERPPLPELGGRGIKVCDRWQLFANFLADMGDCPPGLTIDRIDNDDGYRPGNCRWTTVAMQRRNSRQNRLIEHGGVTLTVTDWAARAGIPRNVLFARLRMGWGPQRALTTPTRCYGAG